MRNLSAFIILFLLFPFVSINDARKDSEDYWKTIMNGDPMPKAIKDFLYQDPAKQETHSDTTSMDHFIKDFGTTPNLIIYHSHVDTQVVKQLAEDVKPNLTLNQKKRNLKQLRRG